MGLSHTWNSTDSTQQSFSFQGDSSSQQNYSFGSVESEDLRPQSSWKIQRNNKGYLRQFCPQQSVDDDDDRWKCWNSGGRADDLTTLLLLLYPSETRLWWALCNRRRGPWEKKNWRWSSVGEPWLPQAPPQCQRSCPSLRTGLCLGHSNLGLWSDRESEKELWCICKKLPAAASCSLHPFFHLTLVNLQIPWYSTVSD